MWFPCSLPAKTWRDTMRKLLDQLEGETGDEILGILCSHQASPRAGRELKACLDYVTDERMAAAEKVDMGAPIDTRQVTCPEKGWVLLFDAAK